MFSKAKLHEVRRVYAILDEQSSSSLVSSELGDELGASRVEEKYYLTTCSGAKETEYRQRMKDVVIQSQQSGLRPAYSHRVRQYPSR